MKKLIGILSCLLFVCAPLIHNTVIKVNAYSENTRLNDEIKALIANGTLPNWHNKYLSNSGYHTLFIKFKNNLTYFSAKTEKSLDSLVKQYNDIGQEFETIVDNLTVPVTELEPNQTVGIYFTGVTFNLLWSSEYIPDEGLNLKSVTMNGIKLNQTLLNTPTCSATNGDQLFEATFSYYFPANNIQLNMTPIAGYMESCDYKYGFNIDTDIFVISTWEAELDPYYYGENIDPTGYYNFETTDPTTFKLSKKPQYKGQPVAQLATHKYIEIKEAEAQSIYDLAFGGYKHYVYFNTELDLDAVYRVDTAYTLANDNKAWYQFWLNGSKEYSVEKSLTADTHDGGIFHLLKSRGLTEGNFASNEKTKIYYKYKLHLNYKDANWDIFSSKTYPESDFKRIQKFKILRMNFVYHGEEFDMDVKMDEISGDTFNIFDRELIMNTDSIIWEFKEGAYQAADKVTNSVKAFFNNLGVIGSVLIGIVVVFLLYKLIYFIIKIFKKKE